MNHKRIKNIHYWYLISFLSSTCLWADKITVFNETDVPLYCALYYSKSTAYRQTLPQEISPHSSISLERPDYKFTYDRTLLFSPNVSDLKEIISHQNFKLIAQQNIGRLKGTRFYLTQDKKNTLHSYNSAQQNIIRNVQKKILGVGKACKKMIDDSNARIIKQIQAAKDAITLNPNMITKNILEQQNLYKTNRYKNTVATVRVGNELCLQEQAAIQARMPRITAAISKFVPSPSYTPKIACIASGGGYRCMTMFLGFITAAEQEGLLDTILWMSSLSGSAWGLGSLCATMAHVRMTQGEKMSLESFQKELFQYVSNKKLGLISASDINLMANMWFVHALSHQPFTLINIYGALIANQLLGLLGAYKQSVYLSDQVILVENGELFIPIYTALQADPGVGTQELGWYEYTPWEIGGAWLGMYVPAWAYGRAFAEGKSTDFGLEKSFGFHLGLYGSAFAASIEEIYLDIKKDIKYEILHNILGKVVGSSGKERLTWGEIYNFTYNMPKSPIRNLKRMRAVDAGLAFNLPYPPVSGERSGRQPDILIFFDASSNIKDGEQLRKAENYARCKGLKFPDINYDGIDKRVISVFKDADDLSVPVVIYLPRVNDPKLWGKKGFEKYEPYIKKFDIDHCVKKDYCGTFNFTYNYEQAKQLSMLADFNLRMAAPLIKQEIAELIRLKSGKVP